MRASIQMCWSRSCSLPRPIGRRRAWPSRSERVAVALLAEDEPAPQNDLGILRAHGVMRP